MAANILCHVCGARPYPGLSLPQIVREDFDLVKSAGGVWRCSQHRDAKAPRAPAAANSKPLDRLEDTLRDLGRAAAKLIPGAAAEDIAALVEDITAQVDRATRLAAQAKRASSQPR